MVEIIATVLLVSTFPCSHRLGLVLHHDALLKFYKFVHTAVSLVHRDKHSIKLLLSVLSRHKSVNVSRNYIKVTKAYGISLEWKVASIIVRRTYILLLFQLKVFKYGDGLNFVRSTYSKGCKKRKPFI